ncbi:Transcriptional regulator, PadR family [Desulfosporosinus sp. I2]|uniref:PadR family transcriptional regulator n=1 Tax=Desulfosporosinus sp. I2 TaxID=1617025 RepID=UPI00061E1027|nr:PadR family transcriptional regulator [Desulfosporosinus sp. I2]KJR44753.1 Transcriptional regulator, PadR family [Desulfosporosinus sp. I2]
MPVKHAILGIIKEAPRHGYELKSIFDERIGNFWNLNYGQIYTTLDRLEKDGFVSGTEEEQDSRPDKKVYDISKRSPRARALAPGTGYKTKAFTR